MDNHKGGTAHSAKAAAEASDEHFDRETTEQYGAAAFNLT